MGRSTRRLALLALAGASACHHSSSSGSSVPGSSAVAPMVSGGACFYDDDGSGSASTGDRLVVGFDQVVRVNASGASALTLVVNGDRFGAGATLVAGPAPDQVTVRLGASPRLRTRGGFAGSLELGAPSAIDVSSSMSADAIESETGIDAQSGEPADVAPGFLADAAFDVSSALSIAAADFDRDGRLDVALGHADGRFTILLGRPGGGFASADAPPPAPLSLPVLSIAAGDLDCDGDLDLVLGTGRADQVWLNQLDAGEPGTFARTRQSLGDETTLGLALVDLNGDGTLDLATAGDPPNRIYRGDGGGGLFEIGAGLSSAPARDVVAADYDRDGDLDVVLAETGGLRIFWNDGSGAFPSNTGPLGGSGSRALATGDVDRDGRLDLVIGANGADAVWRGDGLGGFALEQLFGAGDTHGVALFDADGDGHLDLATCEEDALRVWTNDGAGRLAAACSAIPVASCRALAAGDFDRDGGLDLALALAGAPGGTWRSSLPGTWGDASFEASGGTLGTESTWALASDDTDRDGDPDLALGNASSLALWSNTDGRYSLTEQIATGRVLDAAFADVDLDGDADLALALAGEGLALLMADGDGTFSMLEVGAGLDEAGALVLGDLDCDGDVDLVAGNAEEQPDQVFLNRGRQGGVWLGFSAPATLSGSRHTADLQLGDVDRDGDLDLVSAHGPGEGGSLRTNDGHGSFFESNQSLGQLDTRAAVLFDVDRDDDLEIVLVHALGLAVWENDGTGHFDLQQTLNAPGAPAAWAAAVADFDGDGDTDLFSGGPAGVTVWRNSGSAFETAPALHLEEALVRGLLALDLDLDGDADLVGGTDLGANPIWLHR